MIAAEGWDFQWFQFDRVGFRRRMSRSLVANILVRFIYGLGSLTHKWEGRALVGSDFCSSFGKRKQL
jgi:hypothetical protein